jgi:hypothetical protein
VNTAKTAKRLIVAEHVDNTRMLLGDPYHRPMDPRLALRV